MAKIVIFISSVVLMLSSCSLTRSTVVEGKDGEDGAIAVSSVDEWTGQCEVYFADITDSKFIVLAVFLEKEVEWVVRRDGEQSIEPDPYTGAQYEWGYNWMDEQNSDITSVTFTATDCKNSAVFVRDGDRWVGETVEVN